MSENTPLLTPRMRSSTQPSVLSPLSSSPSSTPTTVETHNDPETPHAHLSFVNTANVGHKSIGAENIKSISNRRSGNVLTSGSGSSIGSSTGSSHSSRLTPSQSNPPTINHRQGPQRTSRTTQKLKLLPDEPNLDDTHTNDEAANRGVYSQVTRIKDASARKDAERLGKAHRNVLPRVTAYCTASNYRMKDMAKYLKSRKNRQANPKLFDECLYTPYSYSQSVDHDRRSNTGSEDFLIRLDDEGGDIHVNPVGRSDIFVFDYGVVVMWGFREDEERRFLKELERFEVEKLADEDTQIEEFNYYVTKSYQPRIYNDFITLRDNSNYMIKLSISHALAQSVKISLFEELVDNTIEDTQDFPEEIALTGKINMNRRDIMKSIGELFILRININLHGSVLDSPELMWAEPHLEPIYQAARGYLEINQRVSLLNQRLEVINDLLQMLKEQLGHSHEEILEWTIIILIAIEILVAVINVIVDLYADSR